MNSTTGSSPSVINSGNHQNLITALSQLGDSSNMDQSWNLMNSSFLSPKISTISGNSGGVTPFTLGLSTEQQQNASHLQMQMAMQQQMNLHRQMLLRKVEVSQHSVNPTSQASAASQDSSAFLGSGQNWTGSRSNPNVSGSSAVQQVPNQSQHQQSQQEHQWSSDVNQPGQSNSPPAAASQSQSNANSSVVNSACESKQAESINNGNANGEMLDFYGWDKLNLDVELNEEDLFGFLKS